MSQLKAATAVRIVPNTVPPMVIQPVAPHATPSVARRRHWFLIFSFFLIVAAPISGAVVYLWGYAADQYASKLSFAVRSEEQNSAIALLGGISELTGAGSSDTDVLFSYLNSQEMVSNINDEVNLTEVWSYVTVSQDPLFAYDPDGTIEDLVDHWERKISVIYDRSTKLIDIEVLAFDPHDAQSIAMAILEESSKMINELSLNAREDSIKYARADLTSAIDTLKTARQSLTRFRNRTQIVDPSIDTQNQMGLLVTLQQKLAEALIASDLLQDTTRAGDPRLEQAERRIKVINSRIEAERQNLGIGTNTESGVVFADLVGEYEGLIVDREIAEAAYTAALTSHNLALAEAQRQSRYLAVHIRPTFAQKPEFPNKIEILIIISLFGFLIWSILSLVYYSLRDRS